MLARTKVLRLRRWVINVFNWSDECMDASPDLLESFSNYLKQVHGIRQFDDLPEPSDADMSEFNAAFDAYDVKYRVVAKGNRKYWLRQYECLLADPRLPFCVSYVGKQDGVYLFSIFDQSGRNVTGRANSIRDYWYFTEKMAYKVCKKINKRMMK